MATPQFATQTNPITVIPGSPGSVTFLTKSPAGTAIDVSSGYTLQALTAIASQNPVQGNGAIDLSSHVSSAFSTTGVTLSWTGAQANAIIAALQTLSNQAAVQLSNDSGTTQSVLSISTLTINVANGLL